MLGLIHVAMSLRHMVTVIAVMTCMISVSCGKKTLSIENAEKPIDFTLHAPDGVTAIDLEVSGLLSGTAHLYLFKPENNQTPWKTLRLIPVVVSGIPMGITPIRFHEKFDEPRLILRYEPDRKTQGHLEIQYRFKSR